MAGLRHLYLSSTGIDDDALRKIALLGDLERLELTSARLTNAGITHLKELENLQYLNLFDTPISDDMVGTLEDRLPRLWVRRE